MLREFERLYKEDQYHTRKWAKHYTKKEYLKINKRLQEKVNKFIKGSKLKNSRDYFIAAMIFQHGFNIPSSKKSLRYAGLAVQRGYKKGKWLIASATDRLLQLQGKPQKFGTQVVNMKAKRPKLYKLNPKTTDKERKEYGLPTLKELKKYYGIK
ncbi:MAG: Tetratricopeptide repeat protein [Candidatus Woesebacteria bacterium GW2011_GWC1_42_9]|nr:MAG: Tetratricopeptide repeat protein [Candidatus Woesebacteria bacterium GW2011_GWC1_42_9]